MSLRQQNLGSIIKPGFNPLGPQTTQIVQYLPYLLGWGSNSVGELGLGNRTKYSSPKQVGSLTDWASLSPNGVYFVVKNDGTLWSKGQNGNGQLGLGNTTWYSSPKQVGALTNWLSVAGDYFALGVKTNGTLWAWGNNNYGQLGNGNVTKYSSPIQVGALTTWVSVSAWGAASFAIKSDGTLWAWGSNSSGKLGLGNNTNYSSPKQVGALTTWSSVNTSYQYGAGWTAAIKTDGTLWTWGNGASKGNLGLGNQTDYSSPKQVGALTNWAKVRCGGVHTLAITTVGTLLAWGANYNGCLGLNNQTYYSSPKQVGALTNWSKIAAGDGQYSVAIKTDGTLWTWGRNNQGQLGSGTTTYRSSPVQVGSLTTWYAIAAGDGSVTALLY